MSVTISLFIVLTFAILQTCFKQCDTNILENNTTYYTEFLNISTLLKKETCVTHLAESCDKLLCIRKSLCMKFNKCFDDTCHAVHNTMG